MEAKSKMLTSFNSMFGGHKDDGWIDGWLDGRLDGRFPQAG